MAPTRVPSLAVSRVGPRVSSGYNISHPCSFLLQLGSILTSFALGHHKQPSYLDSTETPSHDILYSPKYQLYHTVPESSTVNMASSSPTVDTQNIFPEFDDPERLQLTSTLVRDYSRFEFLFCAAAEGLSFVPRLSKPFQSIMA